MAESVGGKQGGGPCRGGTGFCAKSCVGLLANKTSVGAAMNGRLVYHTLPNKPLTFRSISI